MNDNFFSGIIKNSSFLVSVFLFPKSFTYIFQFEPPLPGSALPSSKWDVRADGNVDAPSWKSQGQGAISELSCLNCSVLTVHFYLLFISECVLFWNASNTVGLQAILDMSMSFPFPLLQSQLDPAGISHNRPQLSTAGVLVCFPSQRLLLPDGSC